MPIADGLRLVRDSQPPFYRAMAEASAGGRCLERDGVCAALIPALPDRSVMNSVFYEDPAALVPFLDELAGAYEEAGVRAWTVWVPEADIGTAEALDAAGHTLDGVPRAMACEISEIQEPEPDSELRIGPAEGPDAVADLWRINEIAYGLPPGAFAATSEPIAGTMLWFAELDGERVGCGVTVDHEGDCGVVLVAALPEARGRGLSGRLLAKALEAAAERGCRTTTLQASKLGRPVYERLGYRDFGALEMWERRTSAAD